MALRSTSGWRSARLAGPLLALVAVAACDGASEPAEMSDVARAYLEEVLAPMEAHALHRHTVDWTALRAEVFAAASDAQSITDLQRPIELALRLLGDGRSTFRTASGVLLFVETEPCVTVPANPPSLDDDIGYVRIRAYVGDGSDGDLYIQDVQQEMAENDGEGVIGWIVDLRGNVGGNLWPMLAAVGPLLGEGVVGFYRDADGVDHAWEYHDGTAWLAGTEMHAGPDPYQPRTDARRVAVLTDARTIGAGEALAIAFKGRPESRSFGEETCGATTETRRFVMSDGGTLHLTVYVMADRTGVAYGGRLAPDVVSLAVHQVDDAVEWLRSGN